MTEEDIFVQMGVSEHIAPQLRQAARAARSGNAGAAMTHAWLFTGPPGSGRSIAAMAFAAALECENRDVVGCGRCPQCKAVRAGTHGDVLQIVPRELSIAVDTMRTKVVEPAATRPSVAPWKIIILDNADRLTDGAANALLKTVEEPPEYTVIMMCAPSTDPTDVMPTLVSRSRHVYVPQPSSAEVARILVSEGQANEHDALLAAAATGNHVGRARKLVGDAQLQENRALVLGLAELVYEGDQAFRAVTGIVKKVTKAAEAAISAEAEREVEKLRNALGMGARGRGAQKALRGAATQIKELEDRHKKRKTRTIRDSLDLALVDLAGLYRDAMMQRARAEVQLVHPDMQVTSAELARRHDEAVLGGCIDAIMHAREHIGQSVRPEAALDAMVGRLRLCCDVQR